MARLFPSPLNPPGPLKKNFFAASRCNHLLKEPCHLVRQNCGQKSITKFWLEYDICLTSSYLYYMVTWYMLRTHDVREKIGLTPKLTLKKWFYADIIMLTLVLVSGTRLYFFCSTTHKENIKDLFTTHKSSKSMVSFFHRVRVLDPVFAQKTGSWAVYLDQREIFCIKPFFCFHTLVVRRSIDVLVPENQPGSQSGKIRTGFGASGVIEDVCHRKYENKKTVFLNYL